MTVITDIVPVTIGLSEVPSQQVSYSVPLLLVDDANVPVDQRYKIVTRSSYTTELTAATDAYNWCAAYWGQTSASGTSVYIGKWVSAASESYCYCPSVTTVASVWAALAATAQVAVKEGAAANVECAPDFTGDLTMADVAASIEASFSGAVAAYTCTYDETLGRITVTSDNTGVAADGVTLETPVAGVDLTGPLYLGTEVSVAGVDAESPATAMTTILALDNTPFIIAESGCSTAQQVLLSTGVNSVDKYLVLNSSDPNAYDSGDTTDVGYLLEALNHQKTHICFTMWDTQFPDACAAGEVLAQLNKEGAISLDLNGLSGVYQSGKHGDGTTIIPLTATQMAALDTKGYDYLIDPSGDVVHLRHGLSVGGNEARVMIGKSFHATQISFDVYVYLLQQDVVTFSDKDVQAIKGIETRWTNEMGARGLLDLNTVTRDYPAASEFTSAQKASHTMTLSDVMNCDVLSSANDIAISLNYII